MSVELTGMKTSREHAATSYNGYVMLGILVVVVAALAFLIPGMAPGDGAALVDGSPLAINPLMRWKRRRRQQDGVDGGIVRAGLLKTRRTLL